MGKGTLLWVFLLSLLSSWQTLTAQSADLAAGVSPYSAGPPGQAATPATPAAPAPGAAPAGGAPANGAAKPRIDVPTPDTLPAPSEVKSPPSLGRFRTTTGELKSADMLLDRYQQSVVRVTVRDLAGNQLARAMGVAVGKNGDYIATTLSVILGNSQQWADSIEVTHSEGNTYSAKIAYIDEGKNLVLLAPETKPAPMAFIKKFDERPQISVFTIDFEDSNEKMDDGTIRKIKPKIFKGKLAAADSDSGLLSVAGPQITDKQAGTAVINTQGELVGMLLPKGRGVLSSALQTVIGKIRGAPPTDPTFIGVILGRGVLVDTKLPGAYKSITDALTAIRKGEAPKIDTTRYTPAKERSVAPKESDKIVVKVLPGTYKEPGPINIPSNISLSGSGASQTTILGTNPEKPVVFFQNSENSMLSGFRLVPAPLQKLQYPAVIITKSNKISIQGNILEAKGGVSLWAHQSKQVEVNGNAFPRNESRAISCDKSQMHVEANSFLGDWPIAFSAGQGCNAELTRNLFYENKTSISVSREIEKIKMHRNSFIRDTNGIKLNGKSVNVAVYDNLFFENVYGVESSDAIDVKKIGRNAVWRSKFEFNHKIPLGLDLVKSEPIFENTEVFDFRLKAGRGQLGSGSTNEIDLGAYQRSDYLGPHTDKFMHTLGTAIGNTTLKEDWGMSQ